MLPVARKPIVQYVVEELVSNGIQQMLFVTGRNKSSIENHFDHDPDLFRALSDAQQAGSAERTSISKRLKANFFYTRQRLQKGLGDAVLCGENFAGEEPFLVALGDSILGLHAVSRAVSRMADVYDSKRASCVIAVEEVPREETRHYGIVQPENGGDDVFRIVNLIEKPRPEDAPSNLAIAGRYIFSPVIFDMIRRVKPDARGEIQLTNAIQLLCDEGPACHGGEADARREAVRHRQLPELFRELRGVRAGGSDLRRRIPAHAGAPAGRIRRNGLKRHPTPIRRPGRRC